MFEIGQLLSNYPENSTRAAMEFAFNGKAESLNTLIKREKSEINFNHVILAAAWGKQGEILKKLVTDLQNHLQPNEPNTYQYSHSELAGILMSGDRNFGLEMKTDPLYTEAFYKAARAALVGDLDTLKTHLSECLEYPWGERFLLINSYVEEVTGKNPLKEGWPFLFVTDKIILTRMNFKFGEDIVPETPPSPWRFSQQKPDARPDKDASI